MNWLENKKLQGCIDEIIVEIAKELKTQNYNIYVLSNMAKAIYAYLKSIEFFYYVME